LGVKRFLDNLGVPVEVGLNQGIEDDQQIAHAGCEDGLGRFNTLSKPNCMGPENGVFSGSHKGRYAENLSNLTASP
jgi:hypothetical protein